MPPFSTPMGIMFILVWKMRQAIEFQKERALIQALMAQQGAHDDSIKKAFDDLKEAFFPFDKNQRETDLKKMRHAMEYWVKQGPVIIEAQDDGRNQKKMASKLVRGQQELAKRLSLERAGQSTDMDPIQTAMRKPRRGAS